MGGAQQAARITDPVTHGLGMLGLAGGVLLGAAAGAVLLAALPVTAGAVAISMAGVAALGATAGGGLAGRQLITGIQHAGGLPSPSTGVIGMIGSPNVRVGRAPAARAQADLVTACDGLFSSCHYPIPMPVPIAEGASTIRINGLFAARVGSRVVCGATVKSGAATVYYGGPSIQVLAAGDWESMLVDALGAVGLAALVGAGLLTIPLGVGAIAAFGTVFGAFVLLNYGLGKAGDRIGDGWRDILQGAVGLSTLGVAARVGGRRGAGSTERCIGDFAGIRDAHPSEILKAIPRQANCLGWTEIPGGAKEGVKYQWQDEAGVNWKVRMHGPDPSAPVGSNAKNGWIVRVQRNGKYMDSDGNFHRVNVLNERSPFYSEKIANDTHIPIQTPSQPADFKR